MPALLEEKLETVDTMEVHWSAGTILAIFFAASLISAVFFGLGYSFGFGGTARRPVAAAISDAGSTPEQTGHSGSTTASLPDRRSQQAVGLRTVHIISAKSSAQIAQPTAIPAKKISQPAVSPRYMVQIGAIGNHRDARILVSHLRRKGFHAGIYTGKHDRYLHVQIGPFATAEQAEAVRHRIVANGFHAILKHAS